MAGLFGRTVIREHEPLALAGPARMRPACRFAIRPPRDTPIWKLEAGVEMPVVQERPLRAAGAHDQADRDTRDHALQVGASKRGAVSCDAICRRCRTADEARGHGAHQMRISTTSNFKPGDCFAKPVHEADTPPSDWPATTISISSIPNTPGGPGAIRLADMAALNRSPSCVQFPM
jgi:hypothetical protein